MSILLLQSMQFVFASVAVAGLAIYGYVMRAILRVRKRPVLD